MAQAKLQRIDIFEVPSLADTRAAGHIAQDAQLASAPSGRSTATPACAYTRPRLRPRSDTSVDGARLRAAREELSLVCQSKARLQPSSEKKPYEPGQQRLRQLFQEQTQRGRLDAIPNPRRRPTLRPQPDYHDPRLLRLEIRALLDTPHTTFSQRISGSECLRSSFDSAVLEWLSAEDRSYHARLAADEGQPVSFKHSTPHVIHLKSVRSVPLRVGH
jgi:hypothetical protein